VAGVRDAYCGIHVVRCCDRRHQPARHPSVIVVIVSVTTVTGHFPVARTGTGGSSPRKTGVEGAQEGGRAGCLSVLVHAHVESRRSGVCGRARLHCCAVLSCEKAGEREGSFGGACQAQAERHL